MLFFSDFLFAQVPKGQVRIKEKVVINPQQSLQNINIIGKEGTEGVVSGFVMKKRGVLQIWHSFAHRDKSPIPSNSHLYLNIRNGDTILTDLVVPRFNNTSSNFWNCSGVQTLRYNYISPYAPFSTVSVQRGDTVIFVYVTDLHPSDGVMNPLVISSTDTTQYGWDVTFKYPYICQEEILYISVGVADTVLKFIKPASDSICPNIPRYNDNSTRRNWIDLDLKATFGDSVMKNVWVKVDTAAIADSGGHSHNGNRPMGKYRVPKLPPASGYDTVSTFIRKTDTNGLINFRYLASQFGGIERIKAKLLSDTTSFDTLRIKVKVDSLSLLPNGTNYTKVGGRCEHHGPRDDNNYLNCRTPDNNHWGTSELIGYVRAIADSFAIKYLGYRLRFNDLSLTYGGGFDILGGWENDITDPNRGHMSHRIGENADISFTVVNPQGQPELTDSKKRRKLLDIIRRIMGDPYPHSDHYHLQ